MAISKKVKEILSKENRINILSTSNKKGKRILPCSDRRL
jgi:hypothetical protein